MRRSRLGAAPVASILCSSNVMATASGPRRSSENLAMNYQSCACLLGVEATRRGAVAGAEPRFRKPKQCYY